MLEERYSFSDDNGNITVVTVDEILETYDIKGLTLNELQEKYVNTVDEYYEKLKDMEDKYKELNSNILSLQETIEEHFCNVEPKEYVESAKTTPTLSYIVVLLLAVIIAFLFGKSYSKKEES